MKNTNLYPLKRKLEKARRLTIQAQVAENEAFQLIEEIFGTDFLDRECQFINSDTVSDGISCFINYGEGSADEIINKLISLTNSEENKE